MRLTTETLFFGYSPLISHAILVIPPLISHDMLVSPSLISHDMWLISEGYMDVGVSYNNMSLTN